MFSGSIGKNNKNNRKNKILKYFMAGLIAISLVCMVFSAFSEKENNNQLEEKATGWLQNRILEVYMPVFAFLDETGTQSAHNLWYEAVLSQSPLYKYCEEHAGDYVSTEDNETYNMLIREEGMDEDKKDIGDDSLEYEEDALHIDGDLERAMLEENSLHNKKEEDKENIEKEEGINSQAEFEEAEEKSYEYDWSELAEYEKIVSAFYAIDKTTSITDKQLNLENLLGRDMAMKGKAETPQILIYHTHSQEAFADSSKGDVSESIVGAGERLAEILRDTYGFNVIHHTGQYDVEARDYAYSNALPAVEQLLLENPTIEVVIDLHRDAVDEGRKLAVNLKGRPTAQFMFFNGLSRTRQNGDISYLENPNVDDNLAFSFQAQTACNEYYPGVARRIYLKAYRYNMHLRAKTLLVELGAQTNTVEEIMNACDPLAHVIAKVLSGETGNEARNRAGIKNEAEAVTTNA